MVLTDNLWRGLKPGQSSQAELLAVLGPPEAQHANVAYGSLQGLERLDYGAQGGSAYLHAERLLLLALAPTRANGLQVAMEPWRQALGRPENSHMLASRMAKNARIVLHSSRGLALHVLAERVRLVELFPALTEAQYLERLYAQPPVFTK
ncbi:hypothetical protein I7X39_09285 [Inhella sp. 1Y17]|uniref:Uncharacterized protein n=2 Tax=Inhella proteolytica TaxID=2795029 RepID=A0A931NHI7_9BURK|nr:hypothetical protein [Inhella proteolytica]